MSPRMPVLLSLLALAAAPGGHIDLLIALRGAVQTSDRLWVLPEGARRDALAAEGERTAPVRIFGSSPRALLGNLRDVGRALSMTYGEVDRIAKMIPWQLGMTIEKALAMNKELVELAENDEKVGDHPGVRLWVCRNFSSCRVSKSGNTLPSSVSRGP